MALLRVEQIISYLVNFSNAFLVKENTCLSNDICLPIKIRKDGKRLTVASKLLLGMITRVGWGVCRDKENACNDYAIDDKSAYFAGFISLTTIFVTKECVIASKVWFEKIPLQIQQCLGATQHDILSQMRLVIDVLHESHCSPISYAIMHYFAT